MTVLAVNTGSSSLKFALFEGERELKRGAVEGIGEEKGFFWSADFKEEAPFPTHEAACNRLLDWLDKTPFAIGHRLVHGGERFSEPILLDHGALSYLHSLIPFAPLHLERELKVIAAFQGPPQVGCFDTAFHATMPEKAKRFPLPEPLWEAGVKRYGFHGLSYAYITKKLGSELKERTVIAHLGSGASLAAIKNGKCVDTTMGFTPTGGVIMGTRCGDLDPGVLLYCMRERGMKVSAVEQLVDHQSGLLGIAGSSDMKTLLENRSHDPKAALAVEMFTTSVAKAIGSFAATLGGIDLIVFTGGIGERSEEVRKEILSHLSFLKAAVKVIPTDEEAMIAASTYEILAKAHHV